MDKKAPDRMAQKIVDALNEGLAAGVVRGPQEGREMVFQQFTFRLLEGSWHIFLNPAWAPPRVDDPEPCPNGQRFPECRETDPCEACWQDDNEEGDMIEESMGLR